MQHQAHFLLPTAMAAHVVHGIHRQDRGRQKVRPQLGVSQNALRAVIDAKYRLQLPHPCLRLSASRFSNGVDFVPQVFVGCTHCVREIGFVQSTKFGWVRSKFRFVCCQIQADRATQFATSALDSQDRSPCVRVAHKV